MRVFFLSSHTCVGPSGGGHGVMYRLYLADQKYHYLTDKFDDVVYVFQDKIINGIDSFKYSDMKKSTVDKNKSIIRKYTPSFLRIWKMNKRIKNITIYLKELDNRYKFTDSDIFIFHDFRVANAFINLFDFKRTAMVYHMQGSIYNEWSAETGIISQKMRKYYNNLLIRIIKDTNYFCFPSKGSEESLVKSEPEVETFLSHAKKMYLYNGVNCPIIKKNELKNWIKELSKENKLLFTTIATLNKAKAVERIPYFLGNLKKQNYSFKWILVGNGVMSDEVESSIKKNNIENDTVWIKNSVQHDELMQVLFISDFYILLHKYSIFDLSTLEAMHYGNIPILSFVGGNKEMITEDNGVFVHNKNDISNFIKFLESQNLQEMKEKNIKLQEKKFNDGAFLQRYLNLCEMLGI